MKLAKVDMIWASWMTLWDTVGPSERDWLSPEAGSFLANSFPEPIQVKRPRRRKVDPAAASLGKAVGAWSLSLCFQTDLCFPSGACVPPGGNIASCAILLWAQLGFALFKILEQRQGGYRYGCDLHFFGNCQGRFSLPSLYPIVAVPFTAHALFTHVSAPVNKLT